MQNLSSIEWVSEFDSTGDAMNDSQIYNTTLAQKVREVLQHYFTVLDDVLPTHLYQLVLNEVEPALLEKTLIYTRGNQTKAALLLGLSRGTLRKKLKQYLLEKCK